jgi:hypothetical protein
MAMEKRSVGPIISDFWKAADRNPPGHEASLSRFRRLIRNTQQPDSCTRQCTLTNAYHGGALADVRRIAYALMYAVTHECALVGLWPAYEKTGGMAAVTTSVALRKRCTESGRLGMHCYFMPLSTCHGSSTKAAFHRKFALDQKFHLDVYLDRLQQQTGLRSEVLVMGTLLSWIMRPQPELSEAITRYGNAMQLGQAGSRHRCIGMHVRHGDKHSLYSKHMRNHSWRVAAESFDVWGRRVAANTGADRVLFMTDDAGLMDQLTSPAGSIFNLVPAPRTCLPSYEAGVFGKQRIPAAHNLARLHRQKESEAVSRRASGVSAICGPDYLIDDGIQLFAGVALLGQCASFIGTQISNIDAAAVELQATLRHPPKFYDVLNDMHRACLSDERVWFGGVHSSMRELHKDRLARGDGNQSHGDC